MNRCNDFYNQLNYLLDRADSIVTNVKKLDETNSLLRNIIRNLTVISDDLETDDSPLLTRLDALKTAIENISLSADDLTINAYDDTTLLGKLDALKTAIEGISLSADDLTVNAYDDTTLLGVLTDINTRLTNIDVSLGTGTGNTPVDLSPILESLASISATQTDIASSFSALNSSFESKFSELDLLFSDSSVTYSLFSGDSFSWNSRYQLLREVAANDPIGTVYLAPDIDLLGYSSRFDGMNLEILCDSGIFSSYTYFGDVELKLPANVVALRYRFSNNTWYMRFTTGELRSFDAASSALLRQVFPVHICDDITSMTGLYDGNWYVGWTGAAEFIVIYYDQYSQFFVHLTNLISDSSGMQIELLANVYNFIETCEVHRCIYLSQQMLLRHQLIYDHKLHQISIHFPAFQHLSLPSSILPYILEKAQP